MIIRNFNTSNKIFIVAEIGNNHEGDFNLAIEMINQASFAGADAVKFQTFITDDFISNKDKNRFSRLKSFEFSFDEFNKLANHAEKKGLIFFSTPLDIESAIFLNKISPIFKVASGDNNFIQLINKIIDFDKPMIISTGLLNSIDLDKLYNHINTYSKGSYNEDKLAFLHCVSSYPVPYDQTNLKTLFDLQKKYIGKATIGYSDHTIGIDACNIASSIGAQIIEKHFTIDNDYSDFRDHKLSSNPDEFKSMVEKIRLTEKLLGSSDKKVQQCEEDILVVARRSLAPKQNLTKGHILSREDIIWIRPGTGISIGDENEVIGKKLNKNINKGEIFKYKDFEK